MTEPRPEFLTISPSLMLKVAGAWSEKVSLSEKWHQEKKEPYACLGTAQLLTVISFLYPVSCHDRSACLENTRLHSLADVKIYEGPCD